MSPEISALDKHACPACGAQAEWNPTKQKLVCPFCGTESPYQFDRDTGKVAEVDLVTALRELPEKERGWQTERRSVQCQSCRAVMVFDPERVGQNCEFCGSPSLVSYDEIKSPIRPQGLVAVQDRSQPRQGRHPTLVAKQVARARTAGESSARRYRARPLHSLLDLRRAGALSMGCGSWLSLLRRRRRSRQQRQPRRSQRAADAMGSGVRRSRSLL